ncbi:protein YgfX [Fluviicoccus keumensis]|nr:protein YgfX [Fluviicoccus keumensis]
MAGYLAAGAAIWLAVMPLAVQIGLSVLLAILAGVAMLRGRAAAEPVRELSWIGDQASLVLANGQRVRVQWTGVAVWRYLVVLKFRATDIEWTDELVLLPDSIPAQDFRRLKVRLLASG